METELLLPANHQKANKEFVNVSKPFKWNSSSPEPLILYTTLILGSRQEIPQCSWHCISKLLSSSLAFTKSQKACNKRSVRSMCTPERAQIKDKHAHSVVSFNYWSMLAGEKAAMVCRRQLMSLERVERKLKALKKSPNPSAVLFVGIS